MPAGVKPRVVVLTPSAAERSLLHRAGNTGASSFPGFLRCASSKAASASAVTGVRCSYPLFSCSARHRMVLSSRSMSDQRTVGSPNPGRNSSKILQDCTICVSCRWAASVPVVQKQRGDRVNSRESRWTHGPSHLGLFRAVSKVTTGHQSDRLGSSPRPLHPHTLPRPPVAGAVIVQGSRTLRARPARERWPSTCCPGGVVAGVNPGMTASHTCTKTGPSTASSGWMGVYARQLRAWNGET